MKERLINEEKATKATIIYFKVQIYNKMVLQKVIVKLFNGVHMNEL